MQQEDVVGYPDSNKVAATAGTYDKPVHRWISRQGESLDYLGQRAERVADGAEIRTAALMSLGGAGGTIVDSTTVVGVFNFV